MKAQVPLRTVRGLRPLSSVPRRGQRTVPFTLAEDKVQVSITNESGEPILNGKNGVHLNGNGNGNGAHKATVSIEDGAAVPAAQLSTSSPVQEVPQASTSGNGASKAETIANLDAVLGTPKETPAPAPAQAAPSPAATQAAVAAAATVIASSAAGTPYSNPGGRWSQFKTYSTFQRTLQIWGFAFTFFFKYWQVNQKFTYGKEGMTPERVSAKKRELAVWLREELIKLGPTFIKIGQQFSTRVDVLSKEFIEELEKLQDDVPPFEWDQAKQILESSLNCRIEDRYASFDPKPIAAASLGQVYLAKLKNGEPVVVKVQRPGLKQLFDIDLKNVRVIAQWLQKVDPKTDGAARDWVAIYDECARILYQEIDYNMEGNNAQKFANNFKDTPWVKVPRIFWDLTSTQVLTMEYVPGIKINRAEELDRAGLDRKQLAKYAVESYLLQILKFGLFHADCHPGNLAVSADGKLIYYDYGMMGQLPPNARGGLVKLFYGVYDKDPDKCLDALLEMGVLVPNTNDKTAIRRTAEFFLKSFQDRLETQKQERSTKGASYSESFKPQRSKDEAKERRRQILSAIGEDLLSVANDQPFRFPAEFTFLVRSFTVLDGIGKSLDPRFDISEIAAPYARELLLEARPQFARTQEQLVKGFLNQNRAVMNLFTGPNTLEDLGNFARRLENGELKLRVRALEAERALQRVQIMQGAVMKGLVASLFVNVGTVLTVSGLSAASTACFWAAGLFGFMTLGNLLKVANLVKKEKQIVGAA